MAVTCTKFEEKYISNVALTITVTFIKQKLVSCIRKKITCVFRQSALHKNELKKEQSKPKGAFD